MNPRHERKRRELICYHDDNVEPNVLDDCTFYRSDFFYASTLRAALH